MLEKKIVVDKIEVIEKGSVQVREATRILEGGVIISETFHRHVIDPGEDYSNEDPKVQAICAVVHTQEVIDAWASFQATQQQ